jgi:hypothetical protein
MQEHDISTVELRRVEGDAPYHGNGFRMKMAMPRPLPGGRAQKVDRPERENRIVRRASSDVPGRDRDHGDGKRRPAIRRRAPHWQAPQDDMHGVARPGGAATQRRGFAPRLSPHTAFPGFPEQRRQPGSRLRAMSVKTESRRPCPRACRHPPWPASSRARSGPRSRSHRRPRRNRSHCRHCCRHRLRRGRAL